MKTWKLAKLPKLGEEKKPFHLFVIFHDLCNFANFHVFHDFKLIPPVLLTPTIYCFHDQVIPPLPNIFKKKFPLLFYKKII